MVEREPNMYELEFPSPEVPQGNSQGPTLIVALEGYADAGRAVESGASHLLAALDNRLIASFNNDELIDYRSRRPAVTIENNVVTEVEDMSLGLHVLRDNDGKAFLLLSGPEPDLRWDAFTKAVTDLSDRFNVSQTLCVYAAPMAVPHTRPLVISAHGNSADLLKQMFTLDSRITVPGSASLHLERQLHKKGKDVAGYTAHVPHYLSASDYPEATLKLLEAVAHVADLNLPLRTLEADAQRIMTQIEEQVNDSHEIQQVVRMLENQYDEELERHRREHPHAALPGEMPLVSGEELGAEFERFLAALDDHPSDGRADGLSDETEKNKSEPTDDDI